MLENKRPRAKKEPGGGVAEAPSVAVRPTPGPGRTGPPTKPPGGTCASRRASRTLPAPSHAPGAAP